MTQASAAWLEQQADRVMTRQRSQVETAKLIATFSSGVAATIVATTLQVGQPTFIDEIATAVLLLAVLGALAVVALDRLTEADHDSIVREASLRSWDDEQLIEELRIWTLAAVDVNAQTVVLIRLAVGVQVVLSLSAATLAAVALLRG